jgi:hypothetical protein
MRQRSSSSIQDVLAVTASSAVGEPGRRVNCVRAITGKCTRNVDFADFAVDRDGAGVVHHESKDDRQSKAGSFDTRVVKNGSKTRSIVARHANAGVLYGDTDMLALPSSLHAAASPLVV